MDFRRECSAGFRRFQFIEPMASRKALGVGWLDQEYYGLEERARKCPSRRASGRLGAGWDLRDAKRR